VTTLIKIVGKSTLVRAGPKALARPKDGALQRLPNRPPYVTLIPMRKLAILLWLGACAAYAQPVIFEVVNGIAFIPGVSPGSFALAGCTGCGTDSSKVTVTVGGQNAYLRNVDANLHVYFQVPYNVPVGLTTLTVTVAGQTSAPFQLLIEPYAPALVSVDGSGAGLGSFVDGITFKPITAAAPAQAGEHVVAFATGLGATDPPPSGGGAMPTATSRALVTPTVIVGGKAAAVDGAFLVPTLPDYIYEVYFTVPPDIAAGDQEVVLSIGGKQLPAKVTLPTYRQAPMHLRPLSRDPFTEVGRAIPEFRSVHNCLGAAVRLSFRFSVRRHHNLN
jgi:uncharacterized protein (TIGR03437 family)